MARGINKVILIGNLGQDPEVRFTPSGTAVATLSLATSDTWTDRQSGQKNERTEWHRIVLFNKLAEIAQQYVKKGSKLYIEGQLRTRKWQDQGGQDRYSTEIVARDMQMLDSAAQGHQGGGGRGNNSPQGYGQGQQRGAQAGQVGSYPQGSTTGGLRSQQPQNGFGAPDPGAYNDFDDEIPF